MYYQKFSANFRNRIFTGKLGFLSRVMWAALALMIPLALGASILVIGRQTAPNVYAAQTMEETELLAIYALAFDSDPDSMSSLATYYTPTIAAITAAITNTPGKVAVVLADLDDYEDTHVLVIRNGIETKKLSVDSLDLGLERQEKEWDMADGEHLGKFILWARQTYTSPKTIFSFVGHGAPLVPLYEDITETGEGPGEDEGIPQGELTPIPIPTPTPTPLPISPLPPRWAAHSNFTDHHSGSLLSIDALAQALEIGTQAGENRLTVLDLIHCFSASIEELYALSPYTEMIAGAPNYTYSKPDMLGLALDTLKIEWDAPQMANTLVETYHETLPSEGHPRLLLSIDSEKIESIKVAWDETASHLNSAFDADYEMARKHIGVAYNQSEKYDTTLCTEAQDWQLAPPDALSDMADFAQRLAAQFGTESEVGISANKTNENIRDAIQSRKVVTGTPWFAEPMTTTLSVADINIPAASLTDPLPVWSLEGQGISIFTDFAPMNDDNPRMFSWQAAWYTRTSYIERTDTTVAITPYKFLAESKTGVTWADVFHRYWADAQPISLPNTNIDCAPSFLSSRGSGDLAVQTMDGSRFILSSAPITFTANISSAGEATNPLVSFHVLKNDQEIFSSYTTARYMEANSQQTIQANAAWTPPSTGEFELVVAVDVDDRFIENDETDNIRRQTLHAFDEISILYLPTIMR